MRATREEEGGGGGGGGGGGRNWFRRGEIHREEGNEELIFAGGVWLAI